MLLITRAVQSTCRRAISTLAPMRASRRQAKGEPALRGVVSGSAILAVRGPKQRHGWKDLCTVRHSCPPSRGLPGERRRGLSASATASQCYSSTTIASYAVIRRLQRCGIAGRRMGLSSSTMPANYDPQTLVETKLALRDTAVVFSKSY